MKQKLLLALLALFTGVGTVCAQTWTPPTIQGEDPVSGETYKIYNVGAGKFLSMGKAWFTWTTTAILDDTGVDFLLEGIYTLSCTLKNTGNSKYLFTSGNSIAGDAMHVDGGSATNYAFTKLTNGYYHGHDAGGDATSLCWGYNSSFHETGIVAHADATAAGWNCEWVFLKNLDAIPLYEARLNLYNLYLKYFYDDTEPKVAEAKTVYENSSATVADLEAAYNELYSLRYEHQLAVASNNDPRDITEFVLVNADFSAGNIDGWETNYVSGQQAMNIGYQGASYTNGNVTISQFIEAWRWEPAIGDGYLRQKVSGLPEGKYLLECDAIAADQPGGTMPTGAYLYINAAGVDYKTTMATENEKPRHFSCEFLSPGDVDVYFGMKTENTTANWIGADNFTVKFFGIDLSPYAALLADAVQAAQAYTTANTTTGAYNAIQTALSEYNKTWTTSAEYTAAIAAIQAATQNAADMQTFKTSRYATVRANVLALEEQTTKFTDRSGDPSFTTLEEAVAAQDEAFDDIAEVGTATDACITNLRKAASAFAGSVDLIKGQYLDLTDAMLYNAAMRETGGLSLWTIGYNSNEAYPKYNGRCSEFWGANFDFYQIAPELPAGNYNIEVSAFHRAGSYHTYLYANNDEILVLPITNGENSMTDAANSFDAGLYLNSLKIVLDATTDVQIGFKNLDGMVNAEAGYDYSGDNTDKWTIFRDFKIKFFGDDALAVYREEYEEALEAATYALADVTYTNVAGTDRSNLSTAVTTTYPKSVVENEATESQANYEAATETLTSLTTTFKNGVTSWNTYVTALAASKAEVASLFNESVYADVTFTEPTTAASTTDVLIDNKNKLNVATANYVSANYPYDYEPVIGTFGEWTATATVAGQPAEPSYRDNEHWSGETHAYYEQAAEGWGNENGWTIQYEKTAKLPAGDYVIKVAARSSTGTTSLISCTATGNTITMPNNGARTRGINTSGEASWSDNDTFAAYDDSNVITEVGGTGLGWEWRFLPFSLTEETEVTMTFYAEAHSQYQWMSIADGTLLSKQEIDNVVTISDEDEAAPSATVASQVNTDRKLLEGLNTIILPFEVTADEIGAATVLEYTGTSTGADDAVTLNFHEVDPVDGVITLQANTPYAVMVDADQTEYLTFGMKNIAPAENLTVVDENAHFNFVGTYTDLAKGNTVVVSGDYVAGATAFKKAKGGNRIKAYRAYLKKISEGDVQVKFNFGGDIVDGIEAIELLNNLSVDGFYNLQGQKVNSAQKGIYIVNGKKVVVK